MQTRCARDTAICGDFAETDGISESGADFVVALSDRNHVGQAVTDDVRECFVVVAVSAGGGAVGPATFWTVERDAV